MLESEFQKQVIDELRIDYPGCVILMNDAGYLQGIPDLAFFYHDFYAFLEVKPSIPKPKDYRPNQEWYIQKFDEWSFGAMICPENKDEVFDALQQAYRSAR